VKTRDAEQWLFIDLYNYRAKTTRFSKWSSIFCSAVRHLSWFPHRRN